MARKNVDKLVKGDKIVVDKNGEVAPVFVEAIFDWLSIHGEGPFMQRWMCEPPSAGVGFRVLEDEWSEDRKVRSIKQIELESV